MAQPMNFKGTFTVEEGISVTPHNIAENLMPGAEKIIAIAIAGTDDAGNDNEAVFTWSNEYINEYEFNRGEKAIETGTFKVNWQVKK